MTKDEFDVVLSSLEKSSERTRSTYYVFIILNLAALFYAIGAYMVPLPLERMTKHSRALECHIDPTSRADCDKVSPGTKIEFSINSKAKEFQEERHKYVLRSYVEERASQRKFNFPILGFSVDIDFFGIIFALFCPVLYLILISNASNEAEQFLFAVNKASSNAIYLRSILSTQVLSVPMDFQGNPITGTYQFIRRFSFHLISFMPIFTSILALLSYTYLNDYIFTDDKLKDIWLKLMFDFKTLVLLTISQLTTVVISIPVMIWMFLQLRLIANHTSRSYAEAWGRIRTLESNLAA